MVGALNQIGIYAVGNAWLPTFKGEDKVFGDVIKNWLKDEWYPICNVAGDIADFNPTFMSIRSALIVMEKSSSISLRPKRIPADPANPRASYRQRRHGGWDSNQRQILRV
jgi:hypothetical protein